jgi:microcompartment protein CcmL/EutN
MCPSTIFSHVIPNPDDQVWELLVPHREPDESLTDERDEIEDMIEAGEE